jgi:hypothetical protein
MKKLTPLAKNVEVIVTLVLKLKTKINENRYFQRLFSQW